MHYGSTAIEKLSGRPDKLSSFADEPISPTVVGFPSPHEIHLNDNELNYDEEGSSIVASERTTMLFIPNNASSRHRCRYFGQGIIACCAVIVTCCFLFTLFANNNKNNNHGRTKNKGGIFHLQDADALETLDDENLHSFSIVDKRNQVVHQYRYHETLEENNNGASSSPYGFNTTQQKNSTTVLGGDKDKHGCIASAGYVWCEESKECVRPWETDCLDK